MPAVAAEGLDTNNCELEPIRFSGAVQPHGALLVLDAAFGAVEAASDSCGAVLGIPAASLLGRLLDGIVGPLAANALLAEAIDGLPSIVPLALNGKCLSARSSVNAAGQVLVDIEASDPQASLLQQMNYQHRRGLAAMHRSDGVVEICQVATEFVRATTGFDKVMIYRFDAEWNGEIIAEARSETVESYLGLHFPASDIPRQARELFELCKVRLIPDVRYVPSALLTRADVHSIDLGLSSLRSVSPIHVEYLENMGARATLVGALLVEGRLWGLVSCQQKAEAKYFSPAERDALGWLFEDIAALVEARLIRERHERERSLGQRRLKLIDAVRALQFKDLMRPENNADLLGVVGADGFALIVDEAIQTSGLTPTIARIRQLYQRRRERDPATTLFASSKLSADLGLEDVGDGVAGAVIVTVLRKPVVTMIWFRRERHYSVRWAGDPRQAHLAGEQGRLTPRKSFTLFLQEVRGQCLAWTAEELDSAAELRSLVEIDALRKSEAFSLTVMNSIPEHISVLDAEGCILTVNDAWKKYALANDAPQLAASSEGLNYRSICAAAAGDPAATQAAAAWDGIEAVLQGRLDNFTLDYPCDSPYGQRWFRMRVHPVRPPAEGVVVAHEDITARKLAVIELRESEAQLKAAQRIAHLGSWTWDMTSGTNHWSDEQFRIFGYEPGTICPSHEFFFNTLVPEHRTMVGCALEAALVGGAPYDLQCRVIRPDGSVRHIRCQGEIERDAAGIAKCMTGTVLDITERVQAEQALAESEERFSLFMETLPAMAFIKDESGGLVFANRYMERAYRLGDRRSATAGDLFPPELAERMNLNERRALADGQWVSEEEVPTADGQTRLYQTHNFRISRRDKPPLLGGIALDITEQKLAETQLGEMAANLETKVRERTCQLQDLSKQLTVTEERERRYLAQELHDNLGQHLAILGVKLNKLNESTPSAPVAEMVALLDQATQSARFVTRQLSPPILQNLSIVSALEALTGEIRQTYGLHVYLAVEGEQRPLLQAVRILLYRSTRELLINVAKHAKVDSAELTYLADERQLILVVSDEGCGFEKADGRVVLVTDHSFGLRSIAERLASIGGEMDIDSSPNNGTTITLTIPWSVAARSDSSS